ncbi:MAG: restriction endonuclease [Pyrinomonadaceae bacterium]
MTSDTHSKIVICAPASTSLAGVFERWLRELNPEEQGHVPLESILKDESVPLLVFFGTESLKEAISDLRLRPFLKEKVIYHIGGTKELSTDISSAGMRAYLGYKDCPAFMTNPKEGGLFRDAFLAGLISLNDQKTLGTALEDTRKAWGELLDRRTDSEYWWLMQMFALQAVKNLLLIGDAEWRIPAPARFIRIKPAVIHADRPRIEIINLSTVILKWLQEDPKRISALSPEQFEDLVADRLTRAGLSVTKTGKTNTPDGGIDLIAHPKSSSIPYLLAVQIKHSRMNRPVPAGVVRDFRGAITSLPIDIGMIVTNTRFTPDAQWTARQLPRLIRLRSIADLKLWLADEIDGSLILKDFPSTIEVAPGLVIPIPWSIE